MHKEDVLLEEIDFIIGKIQWKKFDVDIILLLVPSGLVIKPEPSEIHTLA